MHLFGSRAAPGKMGFLDPSERSGTPLIRFGVAPHSVPGRTSLHGPWPLACTMLALFRRAIGPTHLKLCPDTVTVTWASVGLCEGFVGAAAVQAGASWMGKHACAPLTMCRSPVCEYSIVPHVRVSHLVSCALCRVLSDPSPREIGYHALPFASFLAIR